MELETLKQKAVEQMAQFSQYAEYFEGCRKATMLKTVKTKKGNIIGEKGEEVLVISRNQWPDTPDDEATIYSLRAAKSGRVLCNAIKL